MQASTTLNITTSSSDDLYKFSVSKKLSQDSERDEKDAHSSEIPREGIQNLKLEREEDKEASPTKKEEEGEEQDTKPPKTPLFWFGILSPGAQSLRSAQTASASMISTIIPKIASLDCEMRELEIRIRRARKFRAKAEAEILKQQKIHVRNADASVAAEI